MAATFTALFLLMLTVTTALRLWLAVRQDRSIAAHRQQVPADFAGWISLADHQKATDYTRAKLRLGRAEVVAEVIVLLAFTFGGGLVSLAAFWQQFFAVGSIAHGLALFASVGAIGLLVDIPFALYRTFVIEQRFGFNRMTLGLFCADLIKQILIAIVLGGPLLAGLLWLMAALGSAWWLWAWFVWLAFNLLLLWLYPTLIAPLFNRFTPLPAGEVKARIERLLARCGFACEGLFVMDGSRRSSHGNAYFTGFGRAKRIVFFDTLLEKLSPTETEAVLAHELGHFRLHHVVWRLALTAVMSFSLLALLGWLDDAPWFYEGLGVSSAQRSTDKAMALILFSLILPVFAFPFMPLLSAFSRRHEFAADAFAARHADREALIAALVKLYRDNAETLTPDTLYALFYASHPPAAERIAHLRALPSPPPPGQRD